MNENLLLILTALLAVSEALSLIPAVKSNGIMQLMINVLKKLMPKKALEEKKE